MPTYCPRARDERAQSITEFLVCLPVLLLILCSVIFLGELFVWRQRCDMAARYSAWRYARAAGSHDRKMAEASSREVKRAFFGAKCDRAGITARERRVDLLEAVKSIEGLVENAKALLGVDESVAEFYYDLPPGMRMFGPTRRVASHHLVCADSWPRQTTGGPWYFFFQRWN